jgi:hypothetical protein
LSRFSRRKEWALYTKLIAAWHSRYRHGVLRRLTAHLATVWTFDPAPRLRRRIHPRRESASIRGFTSEFSTCLSPWIGPTIVLLYARRHVCAAAGSASFAVRRDQQGMEDSPLRRDRCSFLPPIRSDRSAYTSHRWVIVSEVVVDSSSRRVPSYTTTISPVPSSACERASGQQVHSVRVRAQIQVSA